MQQGTKGTIYLSGVFYAAALDEFRFDTFLNIGNTTDFSDTTTSRTVSRCKINLTYLGEFGETVL